MPDNRFLANRTEHFGGNPKAFCGRIDSRRPTSEALVHSSRENWAKRTIQNQGRAACCRGRILAKPRCSVQTDREGCLQSDSWSGVLPRTRCVNLAKRTKQIQPRSPAPPPSVRIVRASVKVAMLRPHSITGTLEPQRNSWAQLLTTAHSALRFFDRTNSLLEHRFQLRDALFERRDCFIDFDSSEAWRDVFGAVPIKANDADLEQSLDLRAQLWCG